ncbi:MAG: exodeoxyribonuclease VII small subunit [Deltaproteobacteria bacterium]|nr:exodeoxyribonuclease VII small subunit [Deltaproteobacteria bacterium]
MARKSPPESETELPFELLMEKLEGVVGRLESHELTLEEAILAYEEGVELARQGHTRLVSAERRIEELTKRGGLRPVEKASSSNEEGRET